MKLLEGQAIGIEMFLEHSSLPMADKILASIRSQKEQMQGIPPEIAQQVEGQSNPQAQEMIQQMFAN